MSGVTPFAIQHQATAQAIFQSGPPFGKPGPQRIPLGMTAAGGKIIAATLGAHTTVRPNGHAQVRAVHFLFHDYFSGQEFSDLCRREHLIVARRAGAQPNQMGRMRKLVEGFSHVYAPDLRLLIASIHRQRLRFSMKAASSGIAWGAEQICGTISEIRCLRAHLDTAPAQPQGLTRFRSSAFRRTRLPCSRKPVNAGLQSEAVSKCARCLLSPYFFLGHARLRR